MAALTEQERAAQRSYWQEHSSEPTVEAMMLDSQASEIDKLERPEVLQMLGSMDGCHVLELGAGIGRFTGELARTAEHVTAVDFMENLIELNKANNCAHRNCSFMAADVTELSFELCAFDIVFSNWLLMYLSDDEVAALVHSSLGWLKEGGTLFFRESCFRQSGDRKRANNPTHYRNPRAYFRIIDGCTRAEPDGRTAAFELVSCKCVDTYVRVKHNQNQVCWKWTKVVRDSKPNGNFRAFLDSNQYSANSILRYERVFGAGYVSTGGAETTREFVGLLGLRPGMRVLDIGCGIGGGDFYMAREHDVYVHGIDLSMNMVLLALERANAMLDSKVSFEIADCTAKDFKEASLDVIYSRDTLLHITDKPALFSRFFKWLKPGGKLLISDYCRAPEPPSPEFGAYIAQRGYDLHSVAGYGGMLSDAGFQEVQAEDRTWQFERCLRRELEALTAAREAFEADFSAADYEAVAGGWGAKLNRVAAGEQRWGLFLATKPQ